MTLDKDPLTLEQDNYLTKMKDVYIVYDLNAWPRNPIEKFGFENCLFGVTSTIKNRDREKYLYSE